MSKTLKIFLWSLIGAVLGVFALGAASNIGREEKKDEETVAEEVTLETFQDSTKYTEVAAEVGDKVAGNWYRIYADCERLSINDWGDSFYISGMNFNSPFSYQGNEVEVDSCDFIYALYGTAGGEGVEQYLDINLSIGSIVYNGETYSITSNSTFKSFSGSVYQLVPNA